MNLSESEIQAAKRSLKAHGLDEENQQWIEFAVNTKRLGGRLTPERVSQAFRRYIFVATLVIGSSSLRLPIYSVRAKFSRIVA